MVRALTKGIWPRERGGASGRSLVEWRGKVGAIIALRDYFSASTSSCGWSAALSDIRSALSVSHLLFTSFKPSINWIKRTRRRYSGFV
jgi:hypothetical protein